MRRIHILTLMLIGIALPSFAETLEFREFTLEPAKGQKTLTKRQINDAITRNQLGLEKSVKIHVKDEKFLYTDIKPVKYASEYADDLTIEKYESKDLGLTIKGTTKEFDGGVEVVFSYSRITKIKDMIYGASDEGVVLAPVFNSFSTSFHQHVIRRTNVQWEIIPLHTSSLSEIQAYVAFRVLSE